MLRRIAALAVFALVVSACGDSASTGTTAVGLSGTAQQLPTTTLQAAAAQAATTTANTAFPVTISAGNGDVTIEQQPTAIISLSPTATEMLFAVGAGDQVIAVDEYSTFPDDAPLTDLSGFTPNIEALVGYEPDLVLVSNDLEDIVATLGTLNIPVLVMAAVENVDGIFAQMEEIGAATGHLAEAVAVTSELRSELEGVIASLPEIEGSLTYYHELDPTFYSITSSTFIGQVYSMLGLENIADPADTDGFGYPQLSVEYIVDTNPDLIFVTDCCGESADTISVRPGWENISAVQMGSVVVVDDDISSRWGPRTIEFLRVVADAINETVMEG